MSISQKNSDGNTRADGIAYHIAAYFYACYCYVNEIEVSNSVIRDRFGIEAKNMSTASRIIKEALEEGKIKLSDPNASPKMRRYIPYWA